MILCLFGHKRGESLVFGLLVPQFYGLGRNFSAILPQNKRNQKGHSDFEIKTLSDLW